MKRLIAAVFMLATLLALTAAAQSGNKKPSPKPTPPGGKPTPPGGKPTPRASATPTPRSSPQPTPATNSVSFVSSVFTLETLIFLLAAGGAAFVLALIVGLAGLSDSGGDAALRGLEAAILAILGGLFARMFIALLLSTAKDLEAAQIAVGWGFFLFPGLVDTIAKFATGHVVTTPEFLFWMAMIVGAFTGLMNGLWQIHDWKGIGWLAFPLDVTWGLAGATMGSLLHVINFAWAGHAGETRYDAHRYLSGMRFKARFALTQGPVMSNLTDGPGIPLFHHERTHVWQSRAFGPLFSLTYLGWMGLWFVPGAIAAMATKDAEAIQSWCYYNNPWETWAYLVGAGPRTGRHPLIWGDLVILGISIPFFLGIISLFVWIFWRVWF
jgi:ABC-type multidrug transport system fused ATPase/permease subunit